MVLCFRILFIIFLVSIVGLIFNCVDIIFMGLGEIMFSLFCFIFFFILIEIIRIFLFFRFFIVVVRVFGGVLEFLFVIIINIFLVLGCFIVFLKILKVFCNVFLRNGLLIRVGCLLMDVFRLLVLMGKVLLKLIILIIEVLYMIIL